MQEEIPKRNPEDVQHVTGWTCKQHDFNRLCPKIFPDLFSHEIHPDMQITGCQSVMPKNLSAITGRNISNPKEHANNEI